MAELSRSCEFQWSARQLQEQCSTGTSQCNQAAGTYEWNCLSRVFSLDIFDLHIVNARIATFSSKTARVCHTLSMPTLVGDKGERIIPSNFCILKSILSQRSVCSKWQRFQTVRSTPFLFLSCLSSVLLIQRHVNRLALPGNMAPNKF